MSQEICAQAVWHFWISKTCSFAKLQYICLEDLVHTLIDECIPLQTTALWFNSLKNTSRLPTALATLRTMAISSSPSASRQIACSCQVLHMEIF